MTPGRLKIWNEDAGQWEYTPGGGSQHDPYSALQGFEAWTFDPASAFVYDDLTIFDQPYFVKVPISRAASIGSIIVGQADHTSITPTYSKFAIYSADGATQLGITVDLTSVWTAQQLVECTLVAPAAVSAPYVWVGMLAVGGGPGIAGVQANNQGPASTPGDQYNWGCALTGATLRMGLLVGALAALPASFDPTAMIEDSASMPWVGLVAA